MTRAVQELVDKLSSLSEREKEEFWQALLEDERLLEDLHDAVVLSQRRGEPDRPFDEFEREERVRRRAKRLRHECRAAR
jgi:hypothetical protein